MTLIDGIGLWCEIAAKGIAGRPAVFLDRDGVIIEEVNYLSRVDDLRVIPGATQAIARCNRLGIPVVVISNQSGIGRSLYGWDDFAAVQAALIAALASEGGHLDAVLACAYHAEGKGPFGVSDHPWRKTITNAMELFDLAFQAKVKLLIGLVIKSQHHIIHAFNGPFLAAVDVINRDCASVDLLDHCIWSKD